MRRLFLLVIVVVGLLFGGYHTMINASHGVYLGIYSPGVEIDEAVRVAIETQAGGKKVALWHSFWNFADRPGPEYAQGVYTRGSVPMYSVGPNQTCAEVIAGLADADIRWWGAYAAQFAPQPMFVRYGWEMNVPSEYGGYSWGAERCGGAATYVQWFRHVHDQLLAGGGTNILHVWCPNSVELGNDTRFDFEAMYPGDAYANWVCLDGYANNPIDTPFDTEFHLSLQRMAALTTGPLMIGETAASETGDGGAAKAAWIRDAMQVQVPKWPQLQAFLWFHTNWFGQTYPFDSTEPSRLAFAESVALPRYLSTYGEPVPTPTPTRTPTVTVTPTPTVTVTVLPTRTPIPTRTPKPRRNPKEIINEIDALLDELRLATAGN